MYKQLSAPGNSKKFALHRSYIQNKSDRAEDLKFSILNRMNKQANQKIEEIKIKKEQAVENSSLYMYCVEENVCGKVPGVGEMSNYNCRYCGKTFCSWDCMQRKHPDCIERHIRRKKVISQKLS